jgi:hypothetical protein
VAPYLTTRRAQLGSDSDLALPQPLGQQRRVEHEPPVRRRQGRCDDCGTPESLERPGASRGEDHAGPVWRGPRPRSPRRRRVARADPCLVNDGRGSCQARSSVAWRWTKDIQTFRCDQATSRSRFTTSSRSIEVAGMKPRRFCYRERVLGSSRTTRRAFGIPRPSSPPAPIAVPPWCAVGRTSGRW